jgi:hypothetical protein
MTAAGRLLKNVTNTKLEIIDVRLNGDLRGQLEKMAETDGLDREHLIRLLIDREWMRRRKVRRQEDTAPR